MEYFKSMDFLLKFWRKFSSLETAREQKHPTNKLPDPSRLKVSYKAFAAEGNDEGRPQHTVTSFHSVTLQERDQCDNYLVFLPQSDSATSLSGSPTELGTLCFTSYSEFQPEDVGGYTSESSLSCEHFLTVGYIAAKPTLPGRRLMSCKFQAESCTQDGYALEPVRGRLALKPDEETASTDSVEIAGFPCIVKLQMRFSVDHPLDVFGCSLKVSLFEEAEKTGDLLLICADGSKVNAHSAVLASIPYFEARLKDNWSGTGWNMNNKLELTLPCPVDRNVVEAFLKYADGDTWSSDELDPSDASFQQDLFSLAEACGLLALCSIVGASVVINPDSISSWLEWLSEEHGPNVRKIREKAEQVVKMKFSAEGSKRT